MTIMYGIPMATCARKALHVVFEKGAVIDYREVDRAWLTSEEFRRMNPAGAVPVLVTDAGVVLTESSIVMRYVDEAFDGPSLQPTDPLRRAHMNLWLKMIDEKYFFAASTITVGTLFRAMMGTPPDEQRLQAMLQTMTDPAQKIMREEAIRQGIDAPVVKAGAAALAEMLRKMEASLSETQWLADDVPTLADSAVLPFILRLQELKLDAAWDASRLPRVASWWSRISDRPATQKLIRLVDPALLAKVTASSENVREALVAALSAPAH